MTARPRGARCGLQGKWTKSTALAVVLLASCAKPVAAPPAARSPVTAAPHVWSYEVTASKDALDVVAAFPAGTATTLSVEEAATAYVADVKVDGGALASPARGVWTLDACARGCTVRYRFRLADAARALEDMNTALPYGAGTESPPSSWLLRPTDITGPTTYRFHVRTQGVRFATGVPPVEGSPDTFGADAADLDSAPYSLVGDFAPRVLRRGSSAIEVATLPGPRGLDDAAVDRWVDVASRAIESYYGRFPVRHLLLVLATRKNGHGEEVEGLTLASGGASILLGVTPEMKADAIPRDWVLTHELTHLAMPTLRRQFHWLEEGMATYVEPLARAQIGALSAEEVWRGLVEGLPHGEPEAGDEGLDKTHTWGRTYWGGALFCFVADLQIRKATAGKKSLQDALAGILAAGGNGEARWSIEAMLQEGDRAVGAAVLVPLHDAWGTSPVKVDLDALWRELGVKMVAGKVTFDDAAPSAGIRKAMTARR